GWWVVVNRFDANSGNRLRLVTVASQTIRGLAAPIDYFDPFASVKLVSDGANWFVEEGARLRVKVTVYTSSGTHDFDPNCYAVQIDGVGGGAGGTNNSSSGGTQGGAAGGGGSGKDASLILEDMTGVQSATITIGAAGAADSAGGDTSYLDAKRTVTFGGGKVGTANT